MKLTSDGTRRAQGVTANGSRAAARRNGLPGLHDYVYRGKLTLEAELPYLCDGGCGRRMEKTGRAINGGLCAVCREGRRPGR